jgi:AI-2 transport protein TqsA
MITQDKQSMILNFAAGMVILFLLVYICKIASNILIPFVVAIFMWYLINAIARFIAYAGLEIDRKWRLSMAVFVLIGMGFFIYQIIDQNAEDIVREAPKYQASLARLVPRMVVFLNLDHTPTAREFFTDIVGQYIDISYVIKVLVGTLTGIAGKAMIVLFYVGFLLYEQKFFDRKIRLMLKSKETEEKIRRILHTIDLKVQRYIGVKAFVSAIDSTLTFLILSFFNVDFAGFWGAMAFFLHFIPYVGSFFAIALPVTIALVQYGDVGVCLSVFTALCVSHAFLGHFLDPYLMGNNLNLSPIFIISNLAMWGMIWGVPGMFLAIPILAIITITLAQFDSTRPIAVLISKTGEIEKQHRDIRRKRAKD